MLLVLHTSLPSQRRKLSADDVIGPLEVMYEFGEIESAGSLDKISPPIVLFGGQTTQVGVLQQALAKSNAWRDETLDSHLHLVVEGCEPSTGIRFCRTYFLKHGTGDILAQDAKDLQRELSAVATSAADNNRRSKSLKKKSAADEDDDDIDDFYGPDEDGKETAEEDEDDIDDFDHQDFKLTGDGEDITSKHFAQLQRDIQRLHSLYIKLWFSLRGLAHDVFLAATDVLDAGTEIQRLLNALLCNEPLDDDFPYLQSLPGHLQGDERLQLHIDCMNALGEIVSLEDVNDLGGAVRIFSPLRLHFRKSSTDC